MCLVLMVSLLFILDLPCLVGNPILLLLCIRILERRVFCLNFFFAAGGSSAWLQPKGRQKGTRGWQGRQQDSRGKGRVETGADGGETYAVRWPQQRDEINGERQRRGR